MISKANKKYTEEFVLNEVTTLFDMVEKDEEIRSINGLLLRRNKKIKKEDSYAPRRWYEWKRSFFDDEDIVRIMDLIDATVEERVVDGCLQGELSAPFGKFTMVNRHSWTEKSEVNANINGNISLSDLAIEAEKDENEDEPGEDNK